MAASNIRKLSHRALNIFMAEVDDDTLSVEVDDDFVPTDLEASSTLFVIITLLIIITILFELLKDFLLDSSTKFTR